MHSLHTRFSTTSCGFGYAGRLIVGAEDLKVKRELQLFYKFATKTILRSNQMKFKGKNFYIEASQNTVPDRFSGPAKYPNDRRFPV